VSAHVEADRDRCVGAGNCVLTLPAVFDQDDQGLVTVDAPEQPDTAAGLLRRAEQLCPAGAITVRVSPAAAARPGPAPAPPPG
jgi:ferredoxin